MAARKKVTKTAKSGEPAGAIRSKSDSARGKVSGSKSARAPSIKAAGVTAAAKKPDKSAVKAPHAAAKPAQATVKAEKIGVKPEKLTAKPAASTTEAAPRKAESPRKTEVPAGKPEARAPVNAWGGQAPEEA